MALTHEDVRESIANMINNEKNRTITALINDITASLPSLIYRGNNHSHTCITCIDSPEVKEIVEKEFENWNLKLEETEFNFLKYKIYTYRFDIPEDMKR